MVDQDKPDNYQRRRNSNPNIDIEIKQVQSLDKDRSYEVPDSLIVALREHLEQEKKQAAEAENIQNRRQSSHHEEEKALVEVRVNNGQDSARRPSPEVADGHISEMPAISIDSCVGERRKKKFQILGKSRENDNYLADVIVTPRLS